MIFTIIFYLLWCFYAYLEGTREAWYWNEKSKGESMITVNEHDLFTWQRAVVGFSMTLSTGIPWSQWYWLAVAGVSMVLIFPFIHNGRMYQVRNDLNRKVYPHRFFDEPSPFSTANLNFSFDQRVIMATASFMLLVLTLWLGG